MSKEILQSKTCKQLREQAKNLNIPGRWDMTKDELIEAILRAEVAETGKVENKKSAKDERKIDNQSVEVEDKDEKQSVSTNIDMSQKLPYVEQVVIGALVAFKLSTGKVKSAKVVKKSTKNRKLKLETNYGAEYIVSFDDVLWVRTSRRWPKGIYKLLKGDSNGKIEQK